MRTFISICLSAALLFAACEKGTTPEPVYTDPITIIDPDNNTSVTGALTIRTAVGQDYTFEKVVFYIDGDSVSTDLMAPYTYLWDTSEYSNGSVHHIWAVAYDSTDSYTSDTVTVTVTIPVTYEFTYKSSFTFTSPAVRVASEGSHLYVALGPDGLSVLDITDVNSPTRIFSFDSADDIKGVASDLPYLVTAESDIGIRLFSYTSNPDTFTARSVFATQGRAWNVKVIGNMIYVADNNALQIASISNYTISAVNRISLEYGVVKDVDAVGSTVYVLDVNGVSAYNVSQPASPVFIARYAQFDGLCQSVSTDGEHVFVGTTSELKMLTAGLVFETNLSRAGGFTGVFAVDSIVFASAGGSTGGAWAYDYSSGSSLVELDHYTLNETSNDIAYANGYVFLASQTKVSIFSF